MADPQKYRDLAVSAREEAAQVNDIEAREKMLDIARLYDSLAAHVEQNQQRDKAD